MRAETREYAYGWFNVTGSRQHTRRGAAGAGGIQRTACAARAAPRRRGGVRSEPLDTQQDGAENEWDGSTQLKRDEQGYHSFGFSSLQLQR